MYSKSTNHSKMPRSATQFHSGKHPDDACTYSAGPEGTRRGFQNSTMKCSGAYRSWDIFATRKRTRCWPHLELSEKLKRRSWRYLRSPVLSLFSTNKNTKFVKTTIYTELFTRRRQKPDKHSTSTYTDWFAQRRWKPEQTTTQRKFWSWTSKANTSRQRRHEQK